MALAVAVAAIVLNCCKPHSTYSQLPQLQLRKYDDRQLAKHHFLLQHGMLQQTKQS